MNQNANSAEPTLVRGIGMFDGFSLVVGGIIGSGIFLVPSEVSQQLGSFGAVLLVWVVGGLLSLAGALSLGELGAALPKTGGLYIYLREAYGRPVGFLYGWALLTMIHTGTIAALGVAFGIYTAQLIPMGEWGQKLVGVGSVVLLTWINCLGLGPGKWVQNVFTIAKLGGIGLLVVLLLMRGQPFDLLANDFWPQDGFQLTLVPFGIALVAVLWAYEGWHTPTFSAGEFKEPQRNLPRSLSLGTLAIVVIYLLANWSYYSVLPGKEIAGTGTVAATAMAQTFGPASSGLVSVLILISIFGANNSTVLLGPRLFYAMAKEGLFFPSVAEVHARYRTPVISIVVQGVWSSLLVLSGTFLELISSVVFTHWIFYAAAVAAVIVLRRRRPDLPRPYKLPGYPVLPWLFILAAAGLTVNILFQFNWKQLIGFAIVFAGIPAYFLFEKLYGHRAQRESD